MMKAPHLLMCVSLLAITACANTLDRDVSSQIYNGDFGNATMNNTLVTSGERGYTESLGRRFAETVPTTITFPFNSPALTDAARGTLRAQADWIRQFPEVRFRVYGHTDLVGSAGYNKALGLRRAQAAVQYLGTQGISRARLEAVVSYGKTQPVIATPGPEERNRRTVTEVSGFVANHPALLNGKYAAVIFREYVAGAVPLHPQNTVIETQTSAQN